LIFREMQCCWRRCGVADDRRKANEKKRNVP
jgi:hypothetical protein